MSKPTHALGWADAQALKLYGWYLGLVYGTAIFGGWIADNWIGQRKAVILGIFIIAAFMTPPDAVSQTLMALPMYALYELGLFMSRILVRAKAPDPEHGAA